ncbi:MAG: fibronectin type III domain-containing protein, partial [Treponema sp.]|nr:fibronectin type III domain-containing protein [Treponema sp.]
MFGKTDFYKPGAALLAALAALLCAACTLGEIPAALDERNGDSGGPSGGSLPAPRGVNAIVSGDTLVISWNPVSGASYYNVYVSGPNDSVSYTYLGQIDSTAISLPIYGLPSGDTYYFKVSAVNSSGAESSQSNAVSVTMPSALGGSLSAPANVTANVQSSSSIYISWDSVSGASYYRVYRAASSSGTYSQVESYVTATNYTDYSLSSNTMYYYKVSAVNSYGNEGSQSFYASATTSGSGGSTTTPLTNGAWANGSLTSVVTEQWYTFTVYSGNMYYVWLNDSDYLSSYGWMDCQIEVRYNSATGSIINSGNTDVTNYDFYAT